MQPIPTDGTSFVEPVWFKKLDDRARTPEYQTAGAAGFDLSVMDDIEVPPHGTIMASTGLVIAAPEGCMLLLAPRSSTWKKWGVRLGNTIGVVDRDYCGDEDEMFLALWNPSPRPARIPGGTRLAQGIFVPVLTTVAFMQTEQMGASRGGWGSTGVA